MRVLAVLALLLQFQPLVGSVICFHDAEMAKAECTMQHEGQPVRSTLTTPSTMVPGGCPSMAYCAPGAPAVPKFTKQLPIAPFVHSAPALPYSSLAPGESLGPPFHPPKA